MLPNVYVPISIGLHLHQCIILYNIFLCVYKDNDFFSYTQIINSFWPKCKNRLKPVKCLHNSRKVRTFALSKDKTLLTIKRYQNYG